MAGRILYFYDADCGMCTAMMRWVRRIDRRGRVLAIPLQSREADPYLGDLDGPARAGSMHVVTPGAGRASGGLAVLRLLEAFPCAAGAARLAAGRPETRRAAERLYRILVVVRDGLGGVTSCAGTSGPSGSS